MAVNKKPRRKNNKSLVTEDNLLNSIEQEVEENSPSTVEKGERFCKWILRYVFERTDEEIEYDIVVAGKDDNSIDAWFENHNELHIIQAKYNTSHNRSQISSFSSDIKRLLKEPYNTLGNNQHLIELSQVLEEYIANDDNNKKIKMFYITSTKLTKQDIQHIKSVKEELENALPNVIFEVYGLRELIELFQMELQELPEEYRTKPKSLLLQNHFENDTTCVAEVLLKEFAEFVSKNIKYLFYSNIRNYLNNTKVNKSIRETFNDSPTDFWFYNNGITIICDNFETEELKKGGRIKITAPQIVNGCQTATTIVEEYNKIKDREKKNNIKGSILIKVIEDKHKKRKDITRYTNNQNAVSAMDFFALETFQKELQEKFRELGYYYEIQRKESKFMKKVDLPAFKNVYKKNELNKNYIYLLGAKFNYILPVKEVIQAYAAGMHLMPAVAGSKSGELAHGGKYWGKLFNENTPRDPLFFLFPFGVMKYAKANLGYGNSKKVDNGKGEEPRRRRKIDFRKACLMLYVATYFRLFIRLLKQTGYISEFENDDPLSVKNVNVYKYVFADEEINTTLLQLTDSVLTAYMDDTVIRNLYMNNLPKFLKTDIEKENAISILIDKIESKLDDSLDDNTYFKFENLIKSITQ